MKTHAPCATQALLPAGQPPRAILSPTTAGSIWDLSTRISKAGKMQKFSELNAGVLRGPISILIGETDLFKKSATPSCRSGSPHGLSTLRPDHPTLWMPFTHPWVAKSSDLLTSLSSQQRSWRNPSILENLSPKYPFAYKGRLPLRRSLHGMADHAAALLDSNHRLRSARNV